MVNITYTEALQNTEDPRFFEDVDDKEALFLTQRQPQFRGTMHKFDTV